MKHFFSAMILFATLLPSFALGAKLTMDTHHSTVRFVVKHLLINPIHGRIPDVTGTLEWDEATQTLGQVDFTAKVASIDTGVEKRDEHLRTADFFDVQNHPEAKFVSSAVRSLGKGKFQLDGSFTIRGVTKPATLRVRYVGKANDPVMKAEKIVFAAEGEILRKEFGVSYGPNAIVGDKVKLFVNLEAVATP